MAEKFRRRTPEEKVKARTDYRRARTPQSKKGKGRVLQQSVREDIIRELGIDPLDIKSTPMGCAGCDIYLSKAARSKFGYGVECKNVEKINVWIAWDQAKTNAENEGLEPLVVLKRNGSEKLAIITFDELLKLIKK